MRGKLISVCAAVLFAVAAGGASATVTSVPKLRVSPASGKPGSTFTVHFTAHGPTGPSDGSSHYYELTSSGGRGKSCLHSASMAPTVTRSNQAMAVKLSPAKLGGHWCTGTHSGSVTETVRPACGPIVAGPAGAEVREAIACPQFIMVDRIGTFSFKVSG
jgi:hypothetical protein